MKAFRVTTVGALLQRNPKEATSVGAKLKFVCCPGMFAELARRDTVLLTPLI